MMNFIFGNPGLSRQSSDNMRPPPSSLISLKAFPALYLGRDDLESGNKILLPPSILHTLSNYRLPKGQPMMFSLQNTTLGNSTNVGVLEFIADNGTCILPNWLFEQLSLDYGADVNLMIQTGIVKAKFVKLQPHKTEFIELPDPRAILERNLTNYVCLTKGDSIQIKVLNKFYMFDVLEVKPQNPTNCICLIEADLEVDFAPPLDYVEKPPDLIRRESSVNLDEEEDKDAKGPFSGKGIKINGQVVDTSQEPKKKINNEQYDPRKHRIPHGIRTNIMGYEFKGEGVKIGETKAPAKIGGGQLGAKPTSQNLGTKPQGGTTSGPSTTGTSGTGSSTGGKPIKK
jgi:ubiquitin fusion degradation protein 1